MGSKITDSNKLLTDKVWALLHYSDGSEFCFQTTLNSDILYQYGIVLEEGKLPRLDKKYLEFGQMVYRQFNFQGAQITLWDSMTYTDETSAHLREYM